LWLIHQPIWPMPTPMWLYPKTKLSTKNCE
jgi:hypothetical protein